MKYCSVCKAKYEDSVSFCPVDGEVLEDDPSSLVGSVLDGQYKIESMLGKGGMGAVYLARHILLGDRVAIKILPPEVRNNAEWLRRFRREGQAARRFRHPNAVTVYDLRTSADGTIYMVMEYVEGHTLEAELKQRGRFTPAEALEILDPIMSVLNTAHEMGVVHRDLKPENIMIGKAMTDKASSVKLLDLGIAKMREIAGAESSGTTELTMAGQVLGTPYYMSPEQWGELSRDGNSEIDGRADIYSLGLVAYQMLSGKRAYAGATLMELRREHLHVNPPPITEAVPEVPIEFSDALQRAIAKDRVDRQGSAGQLANELRAALDGNAAPADALRTFPDIPHAEESSAHTRAVSGATNTHSDVNAPTILTIDAVPTTPPSSDATETPRPVTGEFPTRPQVKKTPERIGGADVLSSSVTVPQAQKVPQAIAGTQKSRVTSLVFIGAGALVLILVVVSIGGVLAFNWFKGAPDSPPTVASSANRKTGSTGVGDTSDTGAFTAEFGRYWLQVDTNNGDAVRAGDLIALKSGQSFKLHFVPRENGYLYIIGPGAQNVPMIFLSARPSNGSGLKTNEVKSDVDFSFPADTATDENWMTLNSTPGREDYTVIFSTEPLSTPGFLAAEATGVPLSETEQAELADFLARHKTNRVMAEVNDRDGTKPFVTVKVPQSKEARASGAPVVFDVRIQHR